MAENASKNSLRAWAIRIMFGLAAAGLLVSGNMSRMFGPSDPVVFTVRKVKVRLSELMADTARFEQACRHANIPVNAQTRMMLFRQVLKGRQKEEIVKIEAERLGLRLSDAEIVQGIQRENTFLNDEGHFDKNILKAFLRKTGTTYDAFLEKKRIALYKKMIDSALEAQITVPPKAIDVFVDAIFERRTGRYVLYDPDDIKLSTTPSDDELDMLFQNRVWQHPERRTLSVLVISELPSALAEEEPSASEDAELAEADRLEKIKASASEGDDRLADNAMAVENDLDQGLSLEEIAAARPTCALQTIAVTAEDACPQALDCEAKTWDDLRKLAFKLPVHQPSDVIRSLGKAYVIMVTGSTPAVTMTRQEADPVLRRVWAQEKRHQLNKEKALSLAADLNRWGTREEAQKGVSWRNVPSCLARAKGEEGVVPEGIPFEVVLGISGCAKVGEAAAVPVPHIPGGLYVVLCDSISIQKPSAADLAEARRHVARGLKDTLASGVCSAYWRSVKRLTFFTIDSTAIGKAFLESQIADDQTALATLPEDQA